MIYLTPEGKQKLEEELSGLTARRPEVAERIEKAKEQGDLKENAEYHDAKDAQGMMEARIRDIQNTLNQAQIIEKSKNSDIVSLGSKIIVEVGGEERAYEIVGANEADPTQRKISNDSPLGREFFGRKKGDIIEIEVPAGKMIYKIKEIK